MTDTHIPVATWRLSLECACPRCAEYVDLLDDPDFWDGRTLEWGESGTERSMDVAVSCPECGQEFAVDLVY